MTTDQVRIEVKMSNPARENLVGKTFEAGAGEPWGVFSATSEEKLVEMFTADAGKNQSSLTPLIMTPLIIRKAQF